MKNRGPQSGAQGHIGTGQHFMVPVKCSAKVSEACSVVNMWFIHVHAAPRLVGSLCCMYIWCQTQVCYCEMTGVFCVRKMSFPHQIPKCVLSISVLQYSKLAPVSSPSFMYTSPQTPRFHTYS